MAEMDTLLADPNTARLLDLSRAWQAWVRHDLPARMPPQFRRTEAQTIPGVLSLKLEETHCAEGFVQVKKGTVALLQVLVGVSGATWSATDRLIAVPEVRLAVVARLLTDEPVGAEHVVGYVHEYLGDDAYKLFTQRSRVATLQTGHSTLFIFRTEAPPPVKAA